jgi:hypothetical protein
MTTGHPAHGDDNTYFFLAPVIVEIVIAACLGLAIATAKSQAPAYAETLQRA